LYCLTWQFVLTNFLLQTGQLSFEEPPLWTWAHSREQQLVLFLMIWLLHRTNGLLHTGQVTIVVPRAFRSSGVKGILDLAIVELLPRLVVRADAVLQALHSPSNTERVKVQPERSTSNAVL
jgi:hypothetical protein